MLMACRQPSQQEKIYQSITGDWLIVYPDHQLKGARQREIYARMQDSIIALTGLKLVRFTEEGQFRQMDSINDPGNWKLSLANEVYIHDGGKGFNDFKADYASYQNETLRIIEYVKKGGEEIRLVWNLKRIPKNARFSDLFSERRNAWRRKPLKPETPGELKQRLALVLTYYADYFKLVTANSRYFTPSRVMIPFTYYQHAMGLRDFDDNAAFAKLFFNRDQAVKAYHFLEQALYNQRKEFPSGKDFVEEYALFMEKLSDEVKKL